MLKKLVLIFIVPLTIACGSSGSIQNRASEQAETRVPEAVRNEHIKRQAQELSDAVLKADYEKAADLTYPKLIELMGGRAKFISTMADGMKDLQSDQFQIVSVAVGEPRDAIKVENQIYMIVPTTMKMKVTEGTLVGEGFMIGVSRDGGENWTFVNSGDDSMDPARLKILFPAAAEKLRIPEVKRPVLYSGPDR